jgi:hypothetical protein
MAATITITREELSGIRAWASVLEASLRDSARTGRIRDDAHDLVMSVWSLLEAHGMDLIWDDPVAADVALGQHIIGEV